MAQADHSLVKIIGFGSTFETWRNYRIDSDIDLAIVGGSLRLIEKILPECDFEFSIIKLKDQSLAFKHHVLENGIVLYEK